LVSKSLKATFGVY